MDLKTLLIAVSAGLASILVLAAAQSAGLAGMPLMLLAPLPIYIAALAWGTMAAVGSSILAIVIAATAISPGMAVLVGFAFTIPASLIGHQANLAQEDADGNMEWYPVASMLFNLTLFLAVGIVMVGYVAGYNIEALTPPFTEAFREIFKTNPPPVPMTDAELANFVTRTLHLMPFVATSVWVIVHVVNIHFAGMICRASGKLPRPKDDLAASVGMPIAGLFVMLASLAGAVLLSGPVQMVASVFAGAFVTSFSLVGLAGVHLRSRNNPLSFVFLMMSYAIIIFFYVPLFLFAIGGVLRTLNTNQITPPPAGPKQS